MNPEIHSDILHAALSGISISSLLSELDLNPN